MIYLETELGLFICGSCKYNGVFTENQTLYLSNTVEQDLSVLSLFYSASSNAILGTINCATGYFEIDKIGGGTSARLQVFSTAAGINVFDGSGSITDTDRHMYAVICVDNEGHMAFGTTTTREFFAYFQLSYPATAGTFGLGAISDPSRVGSTVIRYNSALNDFLQGLQPGGDTDPYKDGGITEPGGGGGSHTHQSVPVDIPGLPTTSAADTGFITLFNPSLAELRRLASYMWSSLFDLAGWQKLFADPMDAILGLSIVPVPVPAGPSKEVKVGNIGTEINLTTASSQYVEVDCGSLNVEEYWGAYLDYAPYTKAELYLPYCGVHPIQIDDVMGRTVAIKYHVDVLSGSCVAFVKCGNTVLYSFAGQCSSSIPINANNWTNVVNGALSIAGSIGTMVATGGLSAPISAGAAVAAGASLAGTAMTMKPQVERSGSMGGTAGMMGIQTPYLILTRPRQALPENQNTFTGYPSYITSTLGDLTGWTTVSEMHLEGVPCTEGEAEEIVDILKSGVIL